jgi:hypothetical protein
MKRDWSGPRAKCDASVCRSCGTTGRLDAAHIISRSIKGHANNGADNCVPLCRSCHEAQHRGELKLIASGLLTTEEQAAAVLSAGSIHQAVELIDGRGASNQLDGGKG